MQQILIGSGAVTLSYFVEYFAIGGGGGGANEPLGGSGSGPVPTQGNFETSPGSTYSITIGAGGTTGNNGSPTSISTITTAPGGLTPGGPDGTRHGAANGTYSGGMNSSGSGGAGAGAGGNATAGGSPNFQYGGNGGIGAAISINPYPMSVGGGGAGEGSRANRDGTNVDGGGGRPPGKTPNVNQGGGGFARESGGSGRVVFRYSDSFPPLTSTTGTVDYVVSGGYRHYTFRSSGSITF